jgi:hypothetical protein
LLNLCGYDTKSVTETDYFHSHKQGLYCFRPFLHHPALIPTLFYAHPHVTLPPLRQTRLKSFFNKFFLGRKSCSTWRLEVRQIIVSIFPGSVQLPPRKYDTGRTGHHLAALSFSNSSTKGRIPSVEVSLRKKRSKLNFGTNPCFETLSASSPQYYRTLSLRTWTSSLSQAQGAPRVLTNEVEYSLSTLLELALSCGSDPTSNTKFRTPVKVPAPASTTTSNQKKKRHTVPVA